MEGNGPSSGDLWHTGLLFAGVDAVSVDRVISHAIGLEDRLFILKAAKKYNHFPEKISEIQLKGVKSLDEIKIQNFELPADIEKIVPSLSLPQVIARKFISKPKVLDKNCTLCGNCIEICPVSAIHKSDKTVYIDYNKCVSCFCCHEICSFNAIKIKKSFLSTLLSRI